MTPLDTPITRDSITDKDLELFNLLRLGMLPLGSLSTEREQSESSRVFTILSEDFVPAFYGKTVDEMSVEETRCWFEKLFSLAMGAKRIHSAAMDRSNSTFTETGRQRKAERERKLEIAKEVDERDRAKVLEAEKTRLEKPPIKGRKPATGVERLVKSLAATKLTRNIIWTTCKASFPALTETEFELAFKNFGG